MNRALTSLHGRPLEVMLTIPLINFFVLLKKILLRIVLFKNTKLIIFSKKKPLRLIRRRTFTKLNGLHKKCTTQL